MFAKLHNLSPPLILTKVLGTFISYDKVVTERNVAKKVDNIKTKLAAWRSLNLSLFGQCSIAKTLGLS